MRYEVGEKVVLKNKIIPSDLRGKSVVIDSYFGSQRYQTEDGFIFEHDQIDHEETEKTHYGSILEELVDERNNDEFTRLLMKRGRVEGDELDAIKPNHYKKNGMDLIDNFKNLFDEKEFRAVMKSNIFRYVVRYEEKNGIQDLFKAIEFAERLIEWEENLE